MEIDLLVKQTQRKFARRISEGKTMRRAMRPLSLGLVLTAIALGVSAGPAQNGAHVKVVFERAIPNIEGKSMVAVNVSYQHGRRSAAHRHAPSAFINAHVLSAVIRSTVDAERAN